MNPSAAPFFLTALAASWAFDSGLFGISPTPMAWLTSCYAGYALAMFAIRKRFPRVAP